MQRRTLHLVRVCIIVALGGAAAWLGGVGGRRPGPDDLVAVYTRGGVEQLTISYPFDGAVFPPEIVPPEFRWERTERADRWLAVFQVQDEGDVIHAFSEEPAWTPTEEQWEEIKRRSTGRTARLVVLALKGRRRNARVLAGGQVSFSTSQDPVGAPIFYREVNLPFIEAVKDPTQICWRFGDIASLRQPPVVLSNLPVCGNCHSFSADGSVLAMDVDYANSKGSYAITKVAEEMVLDAVDIITWDEYRRGDNEQTFGLLSQISPDGRYAISTVKDRSVFVPKDDLAFSQLFFPIKGFLAYYGRETGTFHPLRGADDPNYVQSNPSWSPDGRYVLFARSKAYKLKKLTDTGKVLLSREDCEEFLTGGKTFQFDLYRVPFNEGRGGTAEPVEGASHNGMSNYFGRYSPDGRWIVFCRAASFMLLQPDSELYIIPAAGGEARRLACNLDLMNSWHSWSPNSRWLVFSSKANGPYTQLFLTHIDEEGNSSPPVLLSHFTRPGRAANIPEFVNLAPTAIRTITERFVNDVSHRRAGDEFIKAGDFVRAEREYRKALGLNPDNWEALNKLAFLLFHHKGELAEAVKHLSRAVELSPTYADAHYNLGTALAHLGRLPEAAEHLQQALALVPSNAQAAFNLGVVMQRQGRAEEAVAALKKAIALNPEHAAAHTTLGKLLFEAGDTAGALACMEAAIAANADYAEAYGNMGAVLLSQGKAAEAVPYLERAASLDPANANTLCSLGAALAKLQRWAAAEAALRKAVSLDTDNAPAHFQLAMVLMELGRAEEVLAHLAEAVRIDPAHVEAHYNLGIAMALGGRQRKAGEHLLAAARLDPLVAARLVELGDDYLKEGYVRQAAAIFQQAGDLARSMGDGELAYQIDQKIFSLARP
ncbi:MAG TPA: tetratricopeptide repeat protein [Anaerohalosphaeraceae bacterium]|nr:tetratricopeptide repeat protein [Anaerohalosphaeraceae bacterium]HRT50674.1 tetratricopeptide repeat protein [Anaerohalosphaeraceae bacterium]HRT86656.1 tetratricopeptide repeat protein [Anaerohalosphaeraceae bacterium]